MKLLSLFFVFAMIGCMHPPQGAESTRESASIIETAHNTVFPHPHTHKKGCGHKEKEVDGKMAYEHDGEVHVPHAGHVDKK